VPPVTLSDTRAAHRSARRLETHLTRVYAKLGARGRAEVAARVAAAEA
jgi:DNA-binding CsgD family transcriptional regulator